MKYFSIFIIFISVAVFGQPMAINPKDVHINDYVHQELPVDLLKRIKDTTDVFEIVDGVSYEEAVDLYKRDLDPESNLVLWEEMARVYKLFCKSRCKTDSERMDVYRTLLIRSMYSPEESVTHLKLTVLSEIDAKVLINEYKLKAKPIDVIKR